MRIGNVLYLIGIIYLLGAIIYAAAFVDYEEKQVLCEDAKGNKIPDSKCIEDKGWKDTAEIIGPALFALLFLTLMGYLINDMIKRTKELERRMLEQIKEDE